MFSPDKVYFHLNSHLCFLDYCCLRQDCFLQNETHEDFALTVEDWRWEVEEWIAEIAGCATLGLVARSCCHGESDWCSLVAHPLLLAGSASQPKIAWSLFVTFLKYPHNRHPMTHLLSRDMGCLFEHKLWFMSYLSNVVLYEICHIWPC